MAILVTGGAGFIGGHTVDALLARGETVVCVDDLNDYYDPKRKEATVQEHRKNKHYTFYKADIRNKQSLAIIFTNHPINTVIHLAARAGVRASLEDPELYMTTNILGTLNLLELAREHAIRNFVFASSSSVYGNSKKTPFTEDMKLDEQISPYAVSKKAGENLCYQYSNLYKIPITCLRFFTVYGPRGRPDMAPYLFLDAVAQGKPITVYGDGSTSRDYTYVADIVQGILAAHDNPHAYEVLNLGNSDPVTLTEFIETVEKVTGKPAIKDRREMQPGDVDRTWADVKRTREILNYKPTTSLLEGLTQTYNWYLETDGGRKNIFEPLSLSAVTPTHQSKSGANWINFIALIDEERIEKAKHALIKSLGKENITGKRFLDLGSGSGLFSLAAYQLGAKEIISIDPDPLAIRASTQLRDKYGDKNKWKVVRGSILEPTFLRTLGKFDTVHLRGIANTTGDYHQALKNVLTLLEPKGIMYLASFNKSSRFIEGTTNFWQKMKHRYVTGTERKQKFIERIYGTLILTGVLLSWKNPWSYIKKYRNEQGMDFWTDVREWLSAYPYEGISVAETQKYLDILGYQNTILHRARSIGCNQFLVKRKMK